MSLLSLLGGSPAQRPLTAGRVTAYVGLGLLGLLTGAAGSLVQAGWSAGGVPLALAGTAGLFWGGAHLTRTRLGAVIAAAGWMVAVVLLTNPRPEGDFVFGTGLGSYAFLFGGMLLAVICATLALPPVPLGTPAPAAVRAKGPVKGESVKGESDRRAGGRG